MKSHVWRPLYVVLAVVAAIVAARTMFVPKDFGVQERGYMYGMHRKSNEADWKAVKVKYRTVAYCRECHARKVESLQKSPHGIINCENCHGPAMDHPKDPPTLTIDRRRELCIRCHAKLVTPTSGRGKIRGIDPLTHNPEAECSLCHDPHHPNLEELRHDR
ncbi:MAG TPA: cytochrome C [Verrucomicrobiae bacterium]|nr:cytochrome C [Verrucomicrobiae bacterium]